MATSRKKKTETPPEDHGCVQCEQIGEINARLDGQENTDARIEASIQQLVKNHEEERKATAKEFTDLKCEITRVGTALEISVKNSEQLIKNQTEMITQMKDLTATTAAMKESQDNTKDLFEKHIHESDLWRMQIERRLSKLERTKWFWYTLGTVLIGVASFLSYVASSYVDLIKK